MTIAEITVVRARLDSLPGDAAGLSVDERTRAETMPVAAARQFVAGRSLLRRVLGEALGVEPRRIALLDDAVAKPRLLEPATIDFNLSHGGAWLLVAVARGCSVGIDVEPRMPGRDEAAIATALGPWLDVASDFTQQWARLEAICKVDGRGLTIPIDPDLGAGHSVVDLDLDHDHAAALAWSGGAAQITHTLITRPLARLEA
jgi:4'-phosphopantetheinyl transferase